MPYAQRIGGARCWAWDAPQVVTRSRFTLPRRFDPAGETSDSISLTNRVALLGLDGQWNNARVAITADADWLDVRLELYALIESAEVLVHSSTLREAVHREESGMLYGEVLVAYGLPSDGWRCYAVPNASEHPPRDGVSRIVATLTVWGTETAPAPRELLRDNNLGQPIPVPDAAVQILPVGIVAGVRAPIHLRQLGPIHNTNAATRFLMVFDQVALPVLGDIPVITHIRLMPDQQASFVIPDLGGVFRFACWVGVSTTLGTFTPADAAADMYFTAWYRTP